VSDVETAVERALRALHDAPDGWLALGHRRRLRETFGPWTPPYEPGGPDAGLLRRAALLVESARRALPAWEEAFPGDRRPHELVDMVMPALRGERPEGEVTAAARELREDAERLGVDLDRKAAFFAGMGAVHLGWEAWDGDLDPEIYPVDTTRDTDLDELPGEALAGWALAGDDPAARRDYWRWYVTEAFPAAYAVSE
jgi:hypothetical protein